MLVQTRNLLVHIQRHSDVSKCTSNFLQLWFRLFAFFLVTIFPNNNEIDLTTWKLGTFSLYSALSQVAILLLFLPSVHKQIICQLNPRLSFFLSHSAFHASFTLNSNISFHLATPFPIAVKSIRYFPGYFSLLFYFYHISQPYSSTAPCFSTSFRFIHQPPTAT